MQQLLTSFSAPARWGILVALSAGFTALLTMAQLPAALLLGPMIGGILVENAGAEIRLPKLPFHFAQAVIGCMIARIITPDILHSFARQWFLFTGISVIIILIGCLVGLVISRMKILPGTTAVWGLLPGAASAMMILAESNGADARLVAFMQYLRVVIVALLASLIARFFVHVPGMTAAQVIWFAPLHAVPLLQTGLLIAGGVVLGRISRMPAGMILLPMFIGIALQTSGFITIELPRWLLAMSYLLLGWNVGLRFSRKILLHAARTLLQIIGSILVMILFCAGLAVVLVKTTNVDLLTAYLATSPGGADSVAIIAASTKVDVGFVMAMQISRALLVLLVGPFFSRFFAKQMCENETNNRT